MTLSVPDDADQPSKLSEGAMELVQRIQAVGIDGAGPWKSARHVADEAAATASSSEEAIKRLIATHRLLVTSSGFITGFGGLPAMAVSIPADVFTFYAASTRMVAGIAHLRGYDITSEHVRTMLLVTVLGSSGAAVLGDVGVQIGNKAAVAALKKLPGRVLIEINKKVGFRLLTKFGEKGVVNLVKVLPVVGAGVGATVNATAITGIASFAKKMLPEVESDVVVGESS